MSDRRHRRPTLPHWNIARGSCRWCGQRIMDGTRVLARRWHQDCVTAYKIACWPAIARFHVWKRDRGICQGCRLDLAAESAKHPYNSENLLPDYFRDHVSSWAPAWQADHIRPLIEADPNDLSFWSLENLRVLCDRCHKGETKALAGRRAAARKEAAQCLRPAGKEGRGQ